MRLFIFTSVTVLLLALACGSETESGVKTNILSIEKTEIPIYVAPNFDSIKSNYYTLFPIMNGLFITHDSIKWGVIDSFGKKIIPFYCDGIKALSETKGIASRYTSSHSLNTGIPRYMYYGEYFFFDRNGNHLSRSTAFSIMIEGVSDFHFDRFIIESGPETYLPGMQGDSVIRRSSRWGY